MKIEGARWSVSFAPNATAEDRGEAWRTICRLCINPPRSKEELRRVAILALLNLYEGTPSRRARTLADRYQSYPAGGWRRDRELESLPHPRTTELFCLQDIDAA